MTKIKEIEGIKDRVIAFAKSKNKSIREFERVVGYTNGTISSFTDGTKKETLSKILDAYSDCDLDYLLTGKKFVEKNTYNIPEIISDFSEERKRLEDIILKQQDSIDKLINAITQITNINLNK